MLKPFALTGIGSLPHRDPEDACGLVLRTFDIPFWPQLPNLSFRELMIAQYSEGMPFVQIDPERESIVLHRLGSDDLERFYESYTDTSRIAISEDYARGFHAFLRAIRTRRFETLKGQITGPLTFTLGLKDDEGKVVYFDEELREIALMLLKAKARWQIDHLGQFAEEVLIFIDEPILSALGSSTYLGVSREEALRLLRETSGAIRDSGGIPGIHCCGNADWPLVIESGATVINFDAHSYFENFTIYHEEIRKFLDDGGYLAWGIVPTTDVITDETPESIIADFTRKFEALSRHIPAETLSSRLILTPSCGTGSRTVDETIKIFQLLMRLKEAVA
jgi:methionine synthase II (cobalamin-independent)